MTSAFHDRRRGPASRDALAPATIAHAVYAGRRYAEELDGPAETGDEVPLKREIVELAPLP